MLACKLLDEIDDVTHCEMCHPDNLIPVTLLDGREVDVCGPMAVKLVREGLLLRSELHHFCCVSSKTCCSTPS